MSTPFQTAFVAYVGPSNIHDSQVKSLANVGACLRVHLRTSAGADLFVEFHDVQETVAVRPEGMIVYALCEFMAASPYRHFVFANWDEEDSASIEIRARGFVVRDTSGHAIAAEPANP